jgi:hypothetical protein
LAVKWPCRAATAAPWSSTLRAPTAASTAAPAVDWKPGFVSPQGKLKYDAVARQAIVEVLAPTAAASFIERIDVPRATGP